MSRHQHATQRSTDDDQRHLRNQRADAQARLAASIFEEGVLKRIERHDEVDDGTLARLARESFAAGFAAGAANASQEPPDETAPEHETVRPSLAYLVATLSPRRLEVLQLVARGLTNREIAQVLEISTNTVKAHLAGLLEALDLTNRTEAAVALREYEAERGQASPEQELAAPCT